MTPLPYAQRLPEQVRSSSDINATDKNGVTLLHRAVRFRNPEAVRAALKKGAAVNQTCKRSGSTPLHRAVTYTGAPGTAGKNSERLSIIEILLKAGADPSIRNKQGKTALDYARDSEARAFMQKKTRK